MTTQKSHHTRLPDTRAIMGKERKIKAIDSPKDCLHSPAEYIPKTPFTDLIKEAEKGCDKVNCGFRNKYGSTPFCLTCKSRIQTLRLAEQIYLKDKHCIQSRCENEPRLCLDCASKCMDTAKQDFLKKVFEVIDRLEKTILKNELWTIEELKQELSTLGNKSEAQEK